MTQWSALSPHRQKVLDFNPAWGLCVEFVCLCGQDMQLITLIDDLKLFIGVTVCLR